jgi:hypothetical protein
MQTIVNFKRQNTDAAWVLFAHVIAHVDQRALKLFALEINKNRLRTVYKLIKMLIINKY